MSDAQKDDVLARMRSTFSSAEGYGLPINDKTFLRYLRARNFNFEKAKEMLSATLLWRRDFGTANMEEWKDLMSVENATGKMYCRGLDKEGHALLYMKPGLENTYDHDGNMKHLVYNMERAIACMESRTDQEKLILLIDYEGFSLINSPPMKASLETLSILQNHYPERLFRAYCVRPPWVFNALWNCVYPFIDPVTKEKIVFLRTGPEQIKQNLSKIIDIDVLESCFGGDDAVPFNSTEYINSSFNLDFWSILQLKKTGKEHFVRFVVSLLFLIISFT